MSPIREFDEFDSDAGEVVFTDVDPAIGDVVDVREDILIDDDLVRLARVTNGVDRALRGRFDCGDADVDGIQTVIGALRKIPLGGASRCSRVRCGITHHVTLGAACRDIQPTTERRFNKIRRAVIHNETRSGHRRISKLITGGENLCAVIDERRICSP